MVTGKNVFSLAIWSCLLLVVLVSFLVMLDVLIIGGGPHALTLATLLSNPDQPLCQSSADILQGIQLSKTKAKSVRYKNKKRQLTSKFKQFFEDNNLVLVYFSLHLFYHQTASDLHSNRKSVWHREWAQTSAMSSAALQSGGFLWKMDITVGKSVYRPEHPSPPITHAGAHRSI